MANRYTRAAGSAAPPTAGAGQYLTFSLSDEHYGADILRVQEIRGWEPVTRIPNQPAYVKGVLNLRGAIVPVLDLRQRFGMAQQGYSQDTVIIVLRVSGMLGIRNMGVIVDAVSDVLNAGAADIRSTPELGAGVPTEYISGLVTAGDKMVMLLDVDRLLEDEDEETPTDASRRPEAYPGDSPA
jgi:purine-binding chemotaxis protein CheW